MRVNKKIGYDNVDLCMKGNVAYDLRCGYVEIKLGEGVIIIFDGRVTFNQDDKHLIITNRMCYYMMEDDK